MSECGARIRAKIAWPVRLLLLAAGMAGMGVLAVACWLTPDARGLGTHQQLGLPPCQFRVQWGLRCPSCGMTTAWAHLFEGNVVGACQANLVGAALAVLAVVHVPWLMVSGGRGRWLWMPPNEYWILGMGAAIGSLTLVEWVVRVVLKI